MRRFLSVAAVAAFLTGGGILAVQAAAAPPTVYVQMNSPGDGISSGAARTGNGRRRVRGMRHRGHHRHHHHRHHRH